MFHKLFHVKRIKRVRLIEYIVRVEDRRATNILRKVTIEMKMALSFINTSDLEWDETNVFVSLS